MMEPHSRQLAGSGEGAESAWCVCAHLLKCVCTYTPIGKIWIVEWEGKKEQRLPHDHCPKACPSFAGLWPPGQESRACKLQMVPRAGCEELGTVSLPE